MNHSQLDKEEKQYRELLDMDPANAETSYKLGNLLLTKNDLKAAAVVFLDGFKLNPFCTLLLKGYYGATKTGFYIPSIIVARPVKELTIENYRAVIVDNIRHTGQISFDMVMFLYDVDNPMPICYISLENNNLYSEMGGPKNFLCAFDEGGHSNFGGFEQELTVSNFEKRAIELVKGKYQL
ncbi:MAG: tetratricopeptide repeat protein [Candidatus Heimdallarchaeota archaeon]